VRLLFARLICPPLCIHLKALAGESRIGDKVKMDDAGPLGRTKSAMSTSPLPLLSPLINGSFASEFSRANYDTRSVERNFPIDPTPTRPSRGCTKSEPIRLITYSSLRSTITRRNEQVCEYFQLLPSSSTLSSALVACLQGSCKSWLPLTGIGKDI